MTTAITTEQRGLGLRELRDLLELRQARKLDVVVGASLLNFRDGDLVVAGVDNQLVDDFGFVDPNGAYGLTSQFQNQLAEKADIHVSTLRNLRTKGRLDLWDNLVNGLLHGRRAKLRVATAEEMRAVGIDHTASDQNLNLDDSWYWNTGLGRWDRIERQPIPADQRSFLLRLIMGMEGERGIARALLSQNFAPLDDIDGLFAVLAGIEAAGINPATLRMSGSISETRMYVDVVAPEVWTAAESFLEGYRSPFDAGRAGVQRAGSAPSFEERVAMGRAYQERNERGGSGFIKAGHEPILMAGFRLSNSEVGSGRWSLLPTVTVLGCWNGMTQKKDMFARTHVGSRLEEGVVRWSEDTKRKELELVTAKTKDVVSTALSGEYLGRVARTLQEQGSKRLTEPEHTIDVVAQRLKWSKADRDGIWQHFEMGGQYTAGGVANAVTSYSQTLPADAAWDLDLQAMDALAFAAR